MGASKTSRSRTQTCSARPSPLTRPGEGDASNSDGASLERYRSTNRYIVFQLLPNTLGLRPEVWRVLAKCHDIRNRGEYEGDLSVDERIVNDLITAWQVVAAKVDVLKAIAQ